MTEVVETASPLDAEALAELRADFRGEVTEPGGAGYDDVRAGFNGMFDRKPAVILRPTGAADVIRAIGLAKLSGLPLAIRGGGHSVAGFNSCDDGIVIDMGGMTGIRVDPQKGTARAQGGATWGMFDRETQAFGLATTGGRVTSTGVVGFTIGSGSGWLERKFGFAGDNMIRADVVTADGEVVTATEDENADLLWALRGAGGNFGVVTEIEFRVHPVGPLVYGGLAAFEPDKGEDVIRTWREISDSASDDLGWAVASVTAPPEPFVPEEWHFKRVWGVLGMHAGTTEEAEAALAPLRALKPIVDLWQTMPYTVVQTLIDPPNPFGRRNYWRAHYLSGLDSGTVSTYLERTESIASPFTAFIFLNGGGAIARIGNDDTALGGRTSPYNVHLNSMWEGADGDDANIAWVRGTSEAFGSDIVPGMGLNFQTAVGNAEVQDAFGDSKLERLRKVKTQYDPTNLFRLNQNIEPAA